MRHTQKFRRGGDWRKLIPASLICRHKGLIFAVYTGASLMEVECSCGKESARSRASSNSAGPPP